MHFANLGFVRATAANAFHSTANNDGLRKVIEKWLVRTRSNERTWQTLLDVAKESGDHTLSEYLDNNRIPCKQITVLATQ